MQDPNFPASPRQAELCSARKHVVDLKGNTENIQAINITELLNQVLLPKILFYTQVVNEYSAHVIQDAEVLHKHLFICNNSFRK